MEQKSEAVQVIPTETGVRFEPAAVQEKPPGLAVVQSARARTTREQELAAGAARVAHFQELEKNRPPRIIPDKERKAEGFSTSVFRPNSVYADRLTGSNGMPVSQQLGALMRKVGGGKAEHVVNGLGQG